MERGASSRMWLISVVGAFVGAALFWVTGFLRQLDLMAQEEASWGWFFLGWLVIAVALHRLGRPERWVGAGSAGFAQGLLAIFVMDHGDGDGLWAVVLFGIVFCAVFAGGVAEGLGALRKRPAGSS